MSRTTIIKTAISVFCLIALVLLYVFGGRVIEDDNAVYEANQADDIRDAFGFDPDTLIYDGIGDIDFLQGVTLEGYNEEQLKKMVYIRISTGDSLSEKIIEYTADTDDGRVRSMRNLLLRNYNGPSIVLPDEMPTVTMGTVDHIKDLMPEGKTYRVDDGFGNDAREHVQIDVSSVRSDSAYRSTEPVRCRIRSQSRLESLTILLSGSLKYPRVLIRQNERPVTSILKALLTLSRVRLPPPNSIIAKQIST